MGDGGLFVWVVGDGGRRAFYLGFMYFWWVVWWRVCCRWLIGGGVDVMEFVVCGPMVGCGESPWRYSLGVR